MVENKPIIIDDIDVSKCEHLYREIDCLAHIDFSECCEGYNPSYGYCPNIDCYYKQLKRKEQECEKLKKELQAQRAFTAHEQKLIYCVAYDETCKTGNDCKQEKCIFKDNIKLKQTLTEIKEIADKDFRHTAWEEYAKQLKQILQKISECEV